MPIEDANGALGLLLAKCPSLQPVWDEERRIAATSDAEDIGIYVIFGSLILPALSALLSGERQNRFERKFPQVLPESAEDRVDFRDRIYSVLDEWAAFTNATIRDAVYQEIIGEGGYGGNPGMPLVSSEEMMHHAGPNLLGLRQG